MPFPSCSLPVFLLGAASSSRAGAPGDLWSWVAVDWHWLLTILTSGVLGGLLTKFGPEILKFINDEQQRKHENHAAAVAQRVHDRGRLGPGLRTMIAVGRELEGIAVRLTHDPINEAAAAVQPLTDMRPTLNNVQEPELAPLRDVFHDTLTKVVQWRAQVDGDHADRQAGRPVDHARRRRIDRHEDEDRGEIQRLTTLAEGVLAALEQPVGRKRH